VVSLRDRVRRGLGSERLKADLALLAAAFVWGSSFATDRIAVASLGPHLYNVFRFSLGALTMLLLLGREVRGWTRTEWGGGLLLGLLVFCGGSLQQMGLRYTTAGKAGFITGLYVVFVPLFLALLWREWPGWSSWLASLLAAVGLFLLSAVERLALAPGDGWVLAAAVLWAWQMILIGRLASRINARRLVLLQFVVAALLSLVLTLVLGVERGVGVSLSVSWWAVLYSGVLSVGLGYMFQAVGQRQAPASDAAVILSGEVIFAAGTGWLLLGETLTPQQLLGCGLMLMGMVLAQLRARARARARSVAEAAGH